MTAGWVLAAYLIIYGMVAVYISTLVLRTRRARRSIQLEGGER